MLDEPQGDGLVSVATELTGWAGKKGLANGFSIPGCDPNDC